MYQDFLERGVVNEDCYITCGNDEFVYRVSFDSENLNHCILTSVEGQIARNRQVIGLVRQLKGVPIFYHTEVNLVAQIESYSDPNARYAFTLVQEETINQIKSAFNKLERSGKKDYSESLL